MTLIALIYVDEFGCTTGGGFLVWVWIMMTTWFCCVHRSWALLCCPSRSGVSTLLVWESIYIASRFASGKFFELCTSLSSHLLYMLKWWRTRLCFCEEVGGWVSDGCYSDWHCKILTCLHLCDLKIELYSWYIHSHEGTVCVGGSSFKYCNVFNILQSFWLMGLCL
jgi:hypothetical protein